MTIIGTIKCDRCPNTEIAPSNGSYPDNWGAVTFKMSRHPDTMTLSKFRDKRRWFHVCPACSAALRDFLNELQDHADTVTDLSNSSEQIVRDFKRVEDV